MATDYISALNAGTGLNTTEIIDSLVAAERAPREKIITDNKDDRTVSISALGQVKTGLSGFNSTLGVVKTVSGLAPLQPESAATLAVTDASQARAFSHQLEVQSLATSQTLVFDGFTSTTQSLGAGSLTFSFGSWSGGVFTPDADASDEVITIADGADGLSDIRDTINNADIGITASLITTSSGNISLMVQSSTGVEKALSITATETVGGSGLASLGYTAYDNTIELTAAADARLTLDGVTVTRDTNQINDLFDGMELTLLKTTTSAETVGANWDSDTALAAMNVLVNEINAFNATLAELSKRSVDGTDNGPLAGEPLVRRIQNQMRAITTQAIKGYGDDPIYLTNFGLQTERDGTISFDEEKFLTAFRNNPADFTAIVQNKISTSNPGLSASVLSDRWTGGNYALEVDGSGGVTVDGDAITSSNGFYNVTSGDANGLSLTIPAGVTSETIYMGRSIVSQLEQYVDTLLARNNNIDTLISRYNNDLADFDDQLTALDTRMSTLRERYVTQFSAMESLVSSMKNTETALDNMMESWKGMMNN